jgi:hypothetical protein
MPSWRARVKKIILRETRVSRHINDQRERREAAAADVQIATEPNGCLPFAPRAWLDFLLLGWLAHTLLMDSFSSLPRCNRAKLRHQAKRIHDDSRGLDFPPIELVYDHSPNGNAPPCGRNA